MKREFHVRFCESVGVKLPCATRLPLYRISEILSRQGIYIHRSLLSQWVVRCGKELMILRDEMLKLIIQGGNIFIDESPVKFLGEEKSKTGYLWVIFGGTSSNSSYRVYFFRENRCYNNALDLLNNYKGVFH
jgi:transposase